MYPAKSRKAVDNMIATIQDNITQCNAAHSTAVQIGLSVGYAVWDPEKDRTVDDLYNRADQNMYQMKNERKNA